jgi:DNA-binding transcriptional regulator/RsmH inhibitor MraZ
LDTKWRAAVPTKFRPIFADQKDLVLWEPQGENQPFLVLALDDYFDDIYEREYAAAEKSQRADLTHDTLGHMEYTDLDTASRFVLPENFRLKAGFAKGEKLFFLANRTYLEVWPMHQWQAREAARRQARSLLDYTPDPVVRIDAALRGEAPPAASEPPSEGQNNA